MSKIKNIIKEIPLIILVGIFSIPVVLSNFYHWSVDKYIDWAWGDSPHSCKEKQK